MRPISSASMPTRHRLLLFALAGAVVLVASLDGALGACSAALHLAPVVGIFAPLLLGRFPGEALLTRLARTAHRPRRARPRLVLEPRSVARPKRLLLAWDQAVRPPPSSLVVHV